MYKEYVRIVKKKINNEKKKLAELDRIYTVIGSDHRFIETKRQKEFIELYKKNIDSKIKKIEVKIEELSELVKSPSNVLNEVNFNLGISFDDKELLDEYYQLDEYYKNSNAGKKLEKIEDLVLVHKTNYLPENDIMYSKCKTGAKDRSRVYFNHKEMIYNYESCRNTLHFTINAVVSDHDQGSWSDRIYGVIIPFDKVNKENLIATSSADTYFKGEIKLPSGSIIVCPKGSEEMVKSKNSNVTVISYTNDISLDDTIKCILMYKNYKIENVGAHEYIGISSSKDEKDLKKILKENNIIDKDISAHFYSKNRREVEVQEMPKKFIGIIKHLNNENIFSIENGEFIPDDFIRLSKEEAIQLLEELNNEMVKNNLQYDSQEMSEDFECIKKIIETEASKKSKYEYLSTETIEFIIKQLMQHVLENEYKKKNNKNKDDSMEKFNTKN